MLIGVYVCMKYVVYTHPTPRYAPLFISTAMSAVQSGAVDIKEVASAKSMLVSAAKEEMTAAAPIAPRNARSRRSSGWPSQCVCSVRRPAR